MKEFIYKSVGLLTLITGGAVLLGWHFDVVALKSISADWVSMKPNTALCFFLTGLAMLLRISDEAKSRPPWRYGACTLITGAVGIITTLTLLQMIFGIDLGIDQWKHKYL